MEKNLRGFATINKERMREIASAGGRASQAAGTAHRFTQEEATEAGRKGGLAVSQNREHMARIGRLGGTAKSMKTIEGGIL